MEQHPKFNMMRYHADIELEAKISRKIDQFVRDYRSGKDDLCIEDILISILDDAELDPPPGGGLFLKFPFIRSQLRKIEPDLVSDDE